MEEPADEEGDEDLSQREYLFKKITKFYQLHNPQKLSSIPEYVDWIEYHGLASFNKKLRERYGVDIEINKTLFAKLKTNTPSVESKKIGAAAAPKLGPNPFDDHDIWADEPTVEAYSSNPFDNL